MKFFIKMGVLSLLLLINCNLFGQIEKFKALYIFNFVKYIEWPPASKTGDFIIGVMGNDEIVAHLEAIAQKKKIGYQNIVVNIFMSVNDIKPCHLLYVPASKTNEFGLIYNKCSTYNTLIITDKSGFTKQGSSICFFDDSGELKFEISKSNIEKEGLKANSNLFGMGISVQ